MAVARAASELVRGIETFRDLIPKLYNREIKIYVHFIEGVRACTHTHTHTHTHTRQAEEQHQSSIITDTADSTKSLTADSTKSLLRYD